jgi:hypothetical protein
VGPLLLNGFDGFRGRLDREQSIRDGGLQRRARRLPEQSFSGGSSNGCLNRGREWMRRLRLLFGHQLEELEIVLFGFEVLEDVPTWRRRFDVWAALSGPWADHLAWVAGASVCHLAHHCV